MSSFQIAGNGAGAWHYPDPVSIQVRAARLALADGLTMLRSSVNALRSSQAQRVRHSSEAQHSPERGQARDNRRGSTRRQPRDSTLARSQSDGDRHPDPLGVLRSVRLRGDDTTARTRSRPHTNDASGRRLPPNNTKPIGGRIGGRPIPTQSPDHTESNGGAPATAVINSGPALAEPTQVLPPVAAPDQKTAEKPTERPGGQPGGGYPDRPDPTDAAAEVWGLVERAQAGGPDGAQAFGLIYDRYVDTVFRFIYFRVGNRQLAEDLTSDTFLRALKRICSFTWQGRDLGAWLVTIARNLVADHFKSGRYRLEVTTGDVMDADREDRGLEGSPEAAVLDHITNVTLLTAVKQLNPEQQECIVLRFLQGFSVAETAQAMSKNEGAIKALQYRAVRALARLLPEGFRL